MIALYIHVRGLRNSCTYFCINGDSGYSRRWYLDTPFQGSFLSPDQSSFNETMYAVRATVEWIFKEAKVYWTIMDFRRKLRILQDPVGALYRGWLLWLNCRTCFYGNQVSRYFQCEPPTLQVFINSRDLP